MQINEGLRRHDLKGAVSPVIGCDYYESKIDESATVLHFKVKGIEQANDFNRFVQKCYTDILDTEVSSACTPDGEYYVFVELATNDKLGKALFEICADLTELCDIHEWELDIRKIGTQKFKEDDDFTKVFDQYLAPKFDVLDSGPFDKVSSKNDLTQTPSNSDEADKLRSSMGEGWDVIPTPKGLLVLHEATYSSVLVKLR